MYCTVLYCTVLYCASHLVLAGGQGLAPPLAAAAQGPGVPAAGAGSPALLASAPAPDQGHVDSWILIRASNEPLQSLKLFSIVS